VQIYGKISFLKMPSQKISTINNHVYGLPALLPKSSKSYKEKKKNASKTCALWEKNAQ
jgi:hypothetical protein